MRVKKDINLMRVARSRNNVNEKKVKNRETKKSPPKSSNSTITTPTSTTTSQTAISGEGTISQPNQSSDSSNTGTSAATAATPIESTVKMKKDGKEGQAAPKTSTTSPTKKLGNSKLKSNQNVNLSTSNKSNNSGKNTNDEKGKKKGGKNHNNSSCIDSSQSGGNEGCGVSDRNTDETVDRNEDECNIDLENNKKKSSISISSSTEGLSFSSPVSSAPGTSISSSSSNNNKNSKESQHNSGSSDKKPKNATKKQANKVCKELRNLGVNTLIKKDIDDKICRDVVDVKTSICEMVKTKSRINVQSTYNRKSSASEDPKDVEKSKKNVKTKSEISKTKKFIKKNKKEIQVEEIVTLENNSTAKLDEEVVDGHKEDEILEPTLDQAKKNEEKVLKPEENNDVVDNKCKKKKKKEKEIVQTEIEKGKASEEKTEKEEENETDASIQEKSKIFVKKLDELLESKPTDAEIVSPSAVEEKLEKLEKLKQNDEIIIKTEQDGQVDQITSPTETIVENTDDAEKATTIEKDKTKYESNFQKRKYVKKAFVAKKKKEPPQPPPAPIIQVPPPKETPEIKDIYDFNESGNNSDSMDLSNIATKSSSSTSNQPPIYKRKLNSISKSSSFDSKSVNNLHLATPELSNESNKSTILSSSIKNEIDDDTIKDKRKSDDENQEEEKITKNISESDINDSDESDEETLKSKINKSLKLAKAGQKKPAAKPKPKKLTKENVKKIENLTKKKSKKYVKTSSSDGSDDNGDESDASSTLSLRRAKEQLKSAPTAKARKLKLYGFWSGPKRHRMASLNALAKVQCLYENESRSAQELGFVRPTPTFIPPLKTLKPPTPNTPSAPSDDDDYTKEDEKPEKKQKPKKTKVVVIKEDKKSNEDESNEEEEEPDDAESIIITNRSLRNVPGLRGAGNLWEVGSMSSISDVEAVYDSDKSYKGEVRQKKKKKKPATVKTDKKVKVPPKPKEKPKNPPPKKKVIIKKPKPVKIDIEDDDDNDEKSDDDSRSSNLATNKRKRLESETKPTDFRDLVVHKRMASLNASAILTATYEVERQLDKLENAADKNIILSDDDSINEVIIPASPKKVKDVKSENEDEDTKEQVRPVSTSVVILQDTDVTITGVYVNSSLGSSQEAYCKMQYRVQSSVTEERVLRPTGDPPKSYTPLSALSNMRPPGAQVQQESCTPNSAPSSRCETPPRHQPYHPSAHPSIGSHPSMSAFCTPTQLQHHDTGGYYQPAGPLITSHLLPSQQSSGKVLSSPLENDNINLQQPPQSTSAAESSDSDVLITGGDLTPRPQTFRYGPQAPGPYSRPIHQMHCPPYPPSYYSPYSQHPQDMCYSPPYQPYYPAKVYPAAGPYRRYIPGTYYQVPPGEMYEPPPSNPPPPSGSQIVPAGPSGPQHMEHYPGPPYYGYSPGAAQCYSRGLQPYIETPYPSNCPCPMQSCPKNVHTGPLIGSNTSKGPVIGHLGSNNNNNSNNSVTNSTIDATLATCKTEDQSPVIVKPENSFQTSFHDNSSNNDRKDLFEKVALAPLPNYSVNSKVMEPEVSISPARGSTGLPVAPPTQITATQPADQNIVRKARIGKNMVRERQHTHMMSFHTQQNYDHQISSIICGSNTNTNNNISINNNNNNNNSKSNDNVSSQSIKQEVADIIKIENVKEEKDEVIMIIDKPDEIDEKPNVVNLIDDQSDLDKDESVPQTDTVAVPKRRRLLLGGGGGGGGGTGTKVNHTFSIKKTSFKGYKNLIKRTEHKSYLSTAPNNYLTKLDRTSYNNNKMMKRFNMKSGKIGKHRMLMKVRKVVMVPNKKSKMISANNHHNGNTSASNHNNNNKTNTNNNFNKTNSSSTNNNNNQNNNNSKVIITTKETNNETLKEILEKSSDSIPESIAARGYYSESEVVQSKKIKSKKSSESRSKSESSRNNNKNNSSSCSNNVAVASLNIESIETISSNAHDDDNKTKTETVSDYNNMIDQTIHNHGDDDEEDDDEAPLKKPKSKKQKQGKKSKKIKSNKKKCKQKLIINDNVENNNNNNNINNNLIACDKTTNIVKQFTTTNSTIASVSSPTAYTTPSTTTIKRNRSRTRKFSNKKRHRVKQVEQVEEVLVPRRINSIPKWSNGWSWEGEPFQGKIFLNSDDAPVLRTCYPAMRHSEGDVIRPRDCVLLRAGGKRFELPYVAKVAYLWENPEDGEMMMSLLWYYRPEHTEQGRQPIDSLDEVFASRHKDHNSVACIEDKCYVLTFSEYCRYRRELKGFQEGIEEIPSIVPPLYRGNNRQVPPNTSPELVMFCRRVYEFRLKRLMKTPN